MKDLAEKNPNAMTGVLNYLYDQRETFCMDASNYPETEAGYIRQFVQQGAFAVLSEWLESEDPEPVSEIAEVFGLLRSKL